jgi:hypothetical protein
MAFVEIDYRKNDFVSVALLWDTESLPASDSLAVELTVGSDVSRFPVAPESALDAFLHPFVYEPIDSATARMLKALAVPVPDDPDTSDGSEVLA